MFKLNNSSKKNIFLARVITFTISLQLILPESLLFAIEKNTKESTCLAAESIFQIWDEEEDITDEWMKEQVENLLREFSFKDVVRGSFLSIVRSVKDAEGRGKKKKMEDLLNTAKSLLEVKNVVTEDNAAGVMEKVVGFVIWVKNVNGNMDKIMEALNIAKSLLEAEGVITKSNVVEAMGKVSAFAYSVSVVHGNANEIIAGVREIKILLETNDVFTEDNAPKAIQSVLDLMHVVMGARGNADKKMEALNIAKSLLEVGRVVTKSNAAEIMEQVGMLVKYVKESYGNVDKIIEVLNTTKSLLEVEKVVTKDNAVKVMEQVACFAFNIMNADATIAGLKGFKNLLEISDVITEDNVSGVIEQEASLAHAVRKAKGNTDKIMEALNATKSLLEIKGVVTKGNAVEVTKQLALLSHRLQDAGGNADEIIAGIKGANIFLKAATKDNAVEVMCKTVDLPRWIKQAGGSKDLIITFFEAFVETGMIEEILRNNIALNGNVIKEFIQGERLTSQSMSVAHIKTKIEQYVYRLKLLITYNREIISYRDMVSNPTVVALSYANIILTPYIVDKVKNGNFEIEAYLREIDNFSSRINELDISQLTEEDKSLLYNYLYRHYPECIQEILYYDFNREKFVSLILPCLKTENNEDIGISLFLISRLARFGDDVIEATTKVIEKDKESAKNIIALIKAIEEDNDIEKARHEIVSYILAIYILFEEERENIALISTNVRSILKSKKNAERTIKTLRWIIDNKDKPEIKARVSGVIKKAAQLLSSGINPINVWRLALFCGLELNTVNVGDVNNHRGFVANILGHADLNLSRIEFEDGGDAVTNFPDFTHRMLEGADPVKKDRTIDMPKKSAANVSIGKNVFGDVPKVECRRYGRTLVYPDKGARIATHIKLLKQGESESTLAYEYDMMQYISSKKDEWRLQGEYPRGTHRLVRIHKDNFPEEIRAGILKDQKVDMNLAVDSEGYFTAMIYETNLDETGGVPYMTYLNDPDLKHDEFREAYKKNIYDLFVLARHGIFSMELIELFHNQEHGNGRRYDWAVDLKNHQRHRSGAGRLNDITGATLYPNFRLTGPADFAEFYHIDDIIADRQMRGLADDRISRLINMVDKDMDQAKNYIQAALLGDTLLSLALMPPTYLERRDELKGEESNAFLEESLKILFENSYSAYSGQNTEVCNETAVDYDIVVRQMEYFLTRQYVRDSKSGTTMTTLQELYKGASITFEAGGRGWTENGWDIRRMVYKIPSRNPELSIARESTDLGAVNGANPWQELIKALYVSTTLMVVSGELPAPKPIPAGGNKGLKKSIDRST